MPLVTVIDSVFERVRNLADDGRWILIGSLISRHMAQGVADMFFGRHVLRAVERTLSKGVILTTIRGFIRRSMVKGTMGATFGSLAGAAATAFIFDFQNTMGVLLGEPKLLFPLAAVGFTAGSFLGGRVGAGLVAGLIFFLIPGLKTVWNDISLEASILTAVAAAGFFLGKRFVGGKGIGGVINGIVVAMTAFQIGSYMAQLIEGDPDTETSWAGLATILAGAMIGGMLAGPFGAMVGAQIGLAAEEGLRDQEINIGGATLTFLPSKEKEDELREKFAAFNKTLFGGGLSGFSLSPSFFPTEAIKEQWSKVVGGLSWDIDMQAWSNDIAVWWHGVVTGVKPYVTNSWNWLIDNGWTLDTPQWAHTVGTWFTSVFKGAKAGVTDWWNWLIDFNWIENMETWILWVGGWFGGVFKGAKDTVTGWWNSLIDFNWLEDITGWAHKVGSWFAGVFQTARQGVHNWWNWLLKDAFGWLNLSDWVTKVVDWFKDLARHVAAPIQAVWDTLIGGLKAIPDIPGWLQTAVQYLISKLPSFEHGGVVPGPYGQPVPIMAHGGEFIGPSQRFSGGDQPMMLEAHINFGSHKVASVITEVTRKDVRYKANLNSGNVTSR